jgi:hypothetical protein
VFGVGRGDVLIFGGRDGILLGCLVEQKAIGGDIDVYMVKKDCTVYGNIGMVT